MSADFRVDVQGESLQLLPERALYWERTGTLIAADVHLGKAASFRAAAIPLPGGTTTATLLRLSAALAHTGARRLLLLGDFFHAKSGRASRTLAVIADWRSRHPDLEIVLIRGNHDRGAGDPPAEWRFDCRDEPWTESPFAFRHHPAEENGGYVLAGHIHPAVSLSGLARQRERLPCFFFGERLALLPSFGDFTGGASIRIRRGDRVYVVAGDEIVPIGTD
ncbi:MAG TPA: ligase-associated DNA damage response endonuclease PdeM [Thermoanaerobaculia bacterium]|nr:ligase-associated DNA damage response endonuclease PdeM [Thermoanaerobaculia bacterium]